MKIVTIIGARPQFVKEAVVSRSFSKNKSINELIIHTGQHFDTNMSNVFFDEMRIPKPYKNLAISGLHHGAMTGQMLEGIEKVLLEEKPDWVLVYGDTNSTLAGALAAKKLHIKIAHVEAGLRSFNNFMPEEINRILTDRVSDILFAPTEQAIQNLKDENFEQFNAVVLNVGDVMMDAAKFYAKEAKSPSFEVPTNFVLCTMHRAENTDDEENLKGIFSALEQISTNSMAVVLPIHPRTRAKLSDINYDLEKSNIIFIDPVGYLEMVYLLQRCSLVMTDSGGLQKEAYFFQKKCITLREQTEWVELVDNGFNTLTGSNSGKILQGFNYMLAKKGVDFSKELYGNGNAGDKIVEALINYNK